MVGHHNIDEVIARFFAAFSNVGRKRAELQVLRTLCVPECTIAKAENDDVAIYSLDEFIEPREVLLASGDLVDFVEHELQHRTDIHGSIANRTSIYEKSGRHLGQEFRTRGTKSFHLTRSRSLWSITSIVWDDSDEAVASVRESLGPTL